MEEENQSVQIIGQENPINLLFFNTNIEILVFVQYR